MGGMASPASLSPGWVGTNDPGAGIPFPQLLGTFTRKSPETDHITASCSDEASLFALGQAAAVALERASVTYPEQGNILEATASPIVLYCDPQLVHAVSQTTAQTSWHALRP